MATIQIGTRINEVTKKHLLINIRASHLTQWNGQPRWEASYRRAYEAIKHSRWILENLIGRTLQGEILDGNYGKGQG